MSDVSPPLMLPLTAAQVQLVTAKGGARRPRLHLLLAAASNDEVRELAIDPGEQKRLSKSLLNALMVLAAASTGEPAGPTEIGNLIGLSAPSVGTYLKTWVAVGALEQVQGSHRYRLAECWRS
jgi:hypothetical protein